jgi:RNA polymerase sigma factor (TIGR02999 family)
MPGREGGGGPSRGAVDEREGTTAVADPPPGPRGGRVGELLVEWSDGEPGALAALMPEVYGELRALAASYMRREQPGHTLQPTALVHEAFLRLRQQHRVDRRDRARFFALAAHMMRRVLVDHARRRRAGRRGGGQRPERLLSPDELAGTPSPDVLVIHEALEALARIDARKSRIVELRFFAGLRMDDIAETLGLSPVTVAREWRVARAWLFRYLTAGPGGGTAGGEEISGAR